MGNRPGWILQLPHPPKFCGKGRPCTPRTTEGPPPQWATYQTFAGRLSKAVPPALSRKSPRCEAGTAGAFWSTGLEKSTPPVRLHLHEHPGGGGHRRRYRRRETGVPSPSQIQGAHGDWEGDSGGHWRPGRGRSASAAAGPLGAPCVGVRGRVRTCSGGRGRA